MHVPGVSFVVIAYNEERAILQTLHAIDQLDALGEHEVIVIDDGSTDHTASLVESYAAKHGCVTLISKSNAGRGAARVTGLARARMGLVAMVDADVLLPQDWLIRSASALSDDVGFAGGVVIPEGDATWIHETFRLDPRPSPLSVSVTGGNLIGPRRLFERIGFDETLRTAEDIVFFAALEATGIATICLPEVVCRHLEDKGFPRTVSWMFESGISATHQLLRFRPPRLPDIAFAASVLTTVCVGGVTSWQIGALAGAGCVAVVATGHVFRAFVPRASKAYSARLVGACVADSALVASYFAGRIAGFATRNRMPKVARISSR